LSTSGGAESVTSEEIGFVGVRGALCATKGPIEAWQTKHGVLS